MGARNVLMFILVWTFTAVCQADDDISVNCEDVTGTARKEVTFTCSVSLKRPGCCNAFYKFFYTENNTDSAICREEFPHDPCEQRNSFTCRYTPTTVMKGKFRFFIQIECGWELAEFTVNIAETSKQEPVTEGPDTIEENTEDPARGSKAIIIIVAILGSSIFITGMTIFCAKRFRFRRNNPSGFQMKYERGASAEPTMMTVTDAQSETR